MFSLMNEEIVTLTSSTIEESLHNCKLVIDSWLPQLEKYNASIELSLCNELDYNKSIVEYFESKGVKIIFEDNKGPIQKYLNCLKHHHGEIIIGFDCDMVSQDNALETIMNYHEENKDSCISNFGHIMFRDNKLQPLVSGNRVLQSDRGKFTNNALGKGKYYHNVMLQMCGLILYPGYVTELLYKDGRIFNIPKYLKYNDDLYGYFILESLNIPRYIMRDMNIRKVNLGAGSGLHVTHNWSKFIYLDQQEQYYKDNPNEDPRIFHKNEKVYASISCKLEQLPFIKPCIESIKNQTCKVDSINLYIAKYDESLEDYVNSLGVNVRIVEDVGVYTKLYYALLDFPNDSIITFDTDRIYENDIVERYLKCSGDIVSDIRDNSNIDYYPLSQIYGRYVPYPEGFQAILYRKGSMDIDLEVAHKLAKYSDDIYYYVYELRKGIIITNAINNWHENSIQIDECLPTNLHINHNTTLWKGWVAPFIRLCKYYNMIDNDTFVWKGKLYNINDIINL